MCGISKKICKYAQEKSFLLESRQSWDLISLTDFQPQEVFFKKKTFLCLTLWLDIYWYWWITDGPCLWSSPLPRWSMQLSPHIETYTGSSAFFLLLLLSLSHLCGLHCITQVHTDCQVRYWTTGLLTGTDYATHEVTPAPLSITLFLKAAKQLMVRNVHELIF